MLPSIPISNVHLFRLDLDDVNCREHCHEILRRVVVYDFAALAANATLSVQEDELAVRLEPREHLRIDLSDEAWRQRNGLRVNVGEITPGTRARNVAH